MKRLLWVPLLFLAVRGWGASLTFVQFSTGTYSYPAVKTTSITVTAGDLLVLGCFDSGVTSYGNATLTDTQNDSWVSVVSTGNLASGIFFNLSYVKSAVGGITQIKVSDGNTSSLMCTIHEYSGQNKTTPFDVYSASWPFVNGQGSGPITTGSATTVVANDTMVAFGLSASGGILSTQSGVQRSTGSYSGYNLYSQDQVVASPTSTASTWTLSSYFAYYAVEAAFEQPSSGLGTLIIQ